MGYDVVQLPGDAGAFLGHGPARPLLLLELELAVPGVELVFAVTTKPDGQAGGPRPGDEEGAEHDVAELERVAVGADEPQHHPNDEDGTDPLVPPPRPRTQGVEREDEEDEEDDRLVGPARGDGEV